MITTVTSQLYAGQETNVIEQQQFAIQQRTAVTQLTECLSVLCVVLNHAHSNPSAPGVVTVHPLNLVADGVTDQSCLVDYRLISVIE